MKKEKQIDEEKKPTDESTENLSQEESEIDKLNKELSEEKDKFLRLAAEYDNYRKRSVKEKTDAYSAAKSDVISDFLPIIDNFERAAANSESDFDGYKKGVEMIFTQFMNVFSKYGVESFGEEGETFDPEYHNAVMVVEDENLGDNVIAQVFSKGYKLGNKIIREAVVKVANS